jgi:hypothetical protein
LRALRRVNPNAEPVEQQDERPGPQPCPDLVLGGDRQQPHRLDGDRTERLCLPKLAPRMIRTYMEPSSGSVFRMGKGSGAAHNRHYVGNVVAAKGDSWLGSAQVIRRKAAQSLNVGASEARAG